MTPLLFEPISLRGLKLNNRVVLSPMCQYASTNGLASDWHVMHLGRFACANLGMVITEATAVEPRGRISPNCLGLYSDESEAALGRVVSFCKSFGSAKLGVQLAHAGRKSSVTPSFVKRNAVPPGEGGWVPLSPSAYEDGIHPSPEVIAESSIDELVHHWVESTRRAHAIGVDMIELHFGHGYLVNQFLSPLINTRTDEYGGSFDGRSRLALQIFQACRAVFPDEKPIGVRISAVDWVAGGWTLEDSCRLASRLQHLGCDYICTSSGGVSLEQKIVAHPGYQVPFAQAVKSHTGMTTMAVGQIWEPEQAELVLQNGSADLIAIARRLLVNPNWVWMAAVHFNHPLQYAPRYKAVQPRIGLQKDEPDRRGLFMFRTDEPSDTKRWG